MGFVANFLDNTTMKDFAVKVINECIVAQFIFDSLCRITDVFPEPDSIKYTSTAVIFHRL